MMLHHDKWPIVVHHEWYWLMIAVGNATRVHNQPPGRNCYSCWVVVFFLVTFVHQHPTGGQRYSGRVVALAGSGIHIGTCGWAVGWPTPCDAAEVTKEMEWWADPREKKKRHRDSPAMWGHITQWGGAGFWPARSNSCWYLEFIWTWLELAYFLQHV